jgi:hypothetical protein
MGVAQSKQTCNEMFPLSSVHIDNNNTNPVDENHENITLIWYDTKTIEDESVDVLLTKQSLREINNFVRFFYEHDSCLNYIKSISNEKVFLIISGCLCSSQLALFHSLIQIESIFVFCFKHDKYVGLMDQYDKIIGIYTELYQLTGSIKQTIQQCELNSAKFSFSKLPQKNMRNLVCECGSFVFFQLFKEVIRHMPHTNEAKSDMIAQCKKDYIGNNETLAAIEEFQLNYTENDAFKWYTGDTFVYRIINKILRTENIDAFFAYRFFITDLCKQILISHKQFKKKYKSKQLTVYRGMKLLSEDLRMMKDNIGNLFSMNGFMSCSRTYETALRFATKDTARPRCEVVLLIIDININQADKIIFADVSQHSSFDENEILFDIGKCTYIHFRI